MKFYESNDFCETEGCREALSQDEKISVIWENGKPETALMFDCEGVEGQLDDVEWADEIAAAMETGK